MFLTKYYTYLIIFFSHYSQQNNEYLTIATFILLQPTYFLRI